jgi:hypothetical protein
VQRTVIFVVKSGLKVQRSVTLNLILRYAAPSKRGKFINSTNITVRCTSNMKALHLPIIIFYCLRKLMFFNTFRGQSFSIARENSSFLAHFAANHFLLPAKTHLFWHISRPIIFYCPRKLIFFNTFRGQSFSIARENSSFKVSLTLNSQWMICLNNVFYELYLYSGRLQKPPRTLGKIPTIS